VKELLVQQLRPVQPVQAATLTAATQQQAAQAELVLAGLVELAV